jgi:hypothetical protein
VNSVNNKIHDKVNLDEILNRLKEVYSYSEDRQLADLFGISQQDLSNRKKRGTLLPFIINSALNVNVNLHWLFTGKEAPSTGDSSLDFQFSSFIDPKSKELFQSITAILKSRDPRFIKKLEILVQDFEEFESLKGQIEGLKEGAPQHKRGAAA